MAAARRRLHRAGAYRTISAKTCLYTLSPDERFIVHDMAKCLALAGFSGHGYKYAPLIGKRLEDVVTERLGFLDFKHWLAGAQ